MNHTTFPSSSSQQLSPKSIETRKEIFKIISETLRPPPEEEPSQQTVQEKKSSFPKINATPPIRKSISSAKTKSNLGFNTPKDAGPSHTPVTRQKSSNVKNTGKKPGKKGKGGDGEGKKSATEPAVKDCHLSNVLRSANRCLFELREARDSLSDLVAQDEQLARGVRKVNPTEDHKQLAHVALSITNLCREAFIPAHRLNQTAIALYISEDFLRYPSDIRTFDLSSKSRIKLPDVTFNNATVMKLRQVVDLAAETYNKFSVKGRMGEELQEILFCILRGYQDFYAAMLGCQEIFKVLLYTGAKDKAHLQQFLLALSAMERSDLLVEIQELRRLIDEIVILLEKFSWGSFVVYRLAGGSAGTENLPSSYSDEQFVNKNQMSSKSSSSIPTYPAYPLLKAKGHKQLKQKKVVTAETLVEDSVEPSGVKLNMLQGTSRSSLLGSEMRANIKHANSMKKSKFSKNKNIMNADVQGKETPAGDASFQDHYKISESSMNSIGSNANFPRIDSNGNRRSMINLEK